MRALKALVIGMGVLIVVGLAVVVVTIANRTIDGGKPSTDAAFALPDGAEVLETALDGDRIALRLRLADGTTRDPRLRPRHRQARRGGADGRGRVGGGRACVSEIAATPGLIRARERRIYTRHGVPFV